MARVSRRRGLREPPEPTKGYHLFTVVSVSVVSALVGLLCGTAGSSARSKTGKYWLGPAPNRQQLLFWAQQFGSDFHILLFRITLLFNGLYTALMTVTFVPGAYKEVRSGEEIETAFA